MTNLFRRCTIIGEQTNNTLATMCSRKDKTMAKENMAMTKENMTVKDARHFINYYEVAFEDGKPSNTSAVYANACSLVDDYDFLVALITERFGGATGKVNFDVLENYNADEVNRMIDNYVEEALIA